MLVGQLECRGGQTAPNGARAASASVPQRPGGKLHPHQGAKPTGVKCLLTGPILIANEPKKKALIRNQGFLNVVPLVGFELTTYRLQGGCSTN